MSSKPRNNHSAKGPSQRQLRVGETLRHALSDILFREDFFDPRSGKCIDHDFGDFDQPRPWQCTRLYNAAWRGECRSRFTSIEPAGAQNPEHGSPARTVAPCATAEISA